MLRVNFPKVRVNIPETIYNLITTRGRVLNKDEYKYAKELSDELRANIAPTVEKPDANSAIIEEIRAQFADKVKAEHPKTYKKILSVVEPYVFKEAQYHYDVMANASVQNRLIDVVSTSTKILENVTKRDACLKSIEKILGAPLDGTESWIEVEQMLKDKQISCKQREICKDLYRKGEKYNTKRVEKVIERENQIAANEAAAKQYGFWKSYDYVYNMPQ